MAVIWVILFVTAAAFAVIVIATVLVVIGVHQEERRWTLAHGDPPTVLALLARRILGAHFYLVSGRPMRRRPTDRSAR
jgi:hypothetical protein